MIFKKDSPQKPDRNEMGSHALDQAVQQHMQDADLETMRIVVAIAGLLACVAYADRRYCDAEREMIREQLSRIQGLSEAGINAISSILDEHILEVTTTAGQFYMRELRELTDYEVRLEILNILMELAASDETLSLDETHYLRRTADLLGLTQGDYNKAQVRYRDRLSVLNKRNKDEI